MKNEFELAFNEVLEEKQLPREVILEALEAAMVSAYRKTVNASNAQHVEASVDLDTGRVTISAEKEIVDAIQDERTEVALDDAQAIDPDVQIGDMLVVATTPRNFGRVAAQTARQVIQQRIREAERDAQLEYFSNQIGEVLSGIVQATNPQAITLGLDKKAEGVMPRNQQLPGERFRVHDRVRVLLLEVKALPRGPQIILSRAHKKFLRRLLENEVPEIYHGMVEIRSIAREPGHRSKVAVAALQPGVDPVGACVGIRGVRIQAIVRELNDEKIDVIEWNHDPSVYIAKALSPARVSGVYLNEFMQGTKTATVVVPEDQLSLAIGRDGQNARLAAKLTSWRIDIKSLPEATADTIYKLQNNADYEKIAQTEIETIPLVEAILAKKAEGRPVMPEEYKTLSQFVDRVEKGLLTQIQKEQQIEEEKQQLAKANVPDAAYRVTLEELEMSPRITTILGGGGYTTVGDLMLQLELDSDVILGLNGIGPKAMSTIEVTLNDLVLEEVVSEEDIAVSAEELLESEQVAEAEESVETVSIEGDEEIELPDGVDEAAEADVEVSPKVREEPVEAEAEAVAEVAEEIETAEGEPLIDLSELDEEDQTKSLEEIFTMRPDVLEYKADPEDEGDDEAAADLRSEKKKQKKKFVQLEYDPDKDVVILKRQRKRDGEDWEEDWEE